MSDWNFERSLFVQGIERAQSGLRLIVEEGYDDKKIICALIEVEAVWDICKSTGINVGLDLTLLTGNTDLKDFVRHVAISEKPDLWTYCEIDNAHLVVKEIYDFLTFARRDFVKGI